LAFRQFGLEQGYIDTRAVVCIGIYDVTWLVLTLLNRHKPKNDGQWLSYNKADLLAMLAYFSVVSMVSVFYLSKVGVSIFAEDVEWARHTAKKGYGYFNIFVTRGLLLAAVLAYVTFACKLITRNQLFVIIGVVLVIQLATGFRNYAITTCLGMLVCYVNISGSYTTRKMFLAGVTGISLFTLITAYKMKIPISEIAGARFVLDIWPHIDHRVVMEMPRIVTRILYLNDFQGLQWGSTYWWDLYSAMPGPGYSLGDRLFLMLAPGNIIAAIAPLTPSIVGESVMNFGYFGIVLGTAVYYVAVAKVDSIKGSSVLSLSSKLVMCVLLPEATALGLGSFLVSRFLPLVVFILFFVVIRRVAKTAVQKTINRRVVSA
jgi:hypothetical protein